MAPENKSVQVNLRLQPALKAAAEKAAADDHRSLSSLIEKLLADHLRTQPTLSDWHERALARLAGAVADSRSKQIKRGTLTRSYSIQTTGGEHISPPELTSTLRAINSPMKAAFPNGSTFHVYQNRQELLPYFTSDNRLDRARTSEILECLAIDVINEVLFWRVSPYGLATIVNAHREDSEDNDYFRGHGLNPGEWFWPLQMTRNLAEIVHHAAFFGQALPSADRVEFRCEWSGLLERRISDPEMMGYDSGKIARADHRTTVGDWPVSELKKSWPEIVSQLGGPVLRLFDYDFAYTPDVIRQDYVSRLK